MVSLPVTTRRSPRTIQSRGRFLSVPVLIYYGLFLVIPMVALFTLSTWHTEGSTIVFGFTLKNYTQIIETPLYRSILARTIGVGLTAAVLVVPVSFLLGYLLRFVFERRAQLITQAILVTLFAGYLVRIYAWRTILGREGVMNSFLQWVGITDEPLAALIYSPWAVAIALCGLVLPLALLPINSAFANVEREHLEVARDLGAKPLYLLRTVLVPIVMPGITTAFAFAFLLSAGDFVTPSLIGGTEGVMVGNVIADQFRGIGSNWPLGAALVWVTIASVGAAYGLLVWLLKWWTKP